MNLQKASQSGNPIAGVGVASAVASTVTNAQVPHTFIRHIEADGVNIFYRDAGPPEAPTVLLLHGFPASSFMYRELIPRLADRYRVIAPDLPGFGFTVVPEERHYKYSFDALAHTMLNVHGRAQSQALCALRLRLWCSHGLSVSDGAPRTRGCNHFAERQCL